MHVLYYNWTIKCDRSMTKIGGESEMAIYVYKYNSILLPHIHDCLNDKSECNVV